MTTRVLHILPDLQQGDATAQVAMLGRHLPREDFEQHVVVLSNTGSAKNRLIAAGLEVDALCRRFAWDPFAVDALRRTVARLRPDVIHAWGATSACYAALCRGRRKLVATTVGHKVPRFFRRRIDAMLDPPPAADASDSPKVSRDELGLPPDARLIAIVGRLAPESRLKDLIWAIDLVRVQRPDVWLAVVGEGPQQGALRRYTRLACEENRTLWVDPAYDARQVLPRCEMLWTASRSDRTPLAVLVAMAAGLPVVGDRSRGVEAAVEHEETGLLVPLGDRASRGKATVRLLDDAGRRESLGQAARQRAEEAFPLEPWLDAHRKAYGE